MTATVAVINDVRPHGDNLTIVTVAGNEVVANRKEDGSYRWEAGEVCVYVAEGSIIPDDVLKARGYWDDEKGKGLLEGKKGNRVKMRRFAGHESRGLLFKLDDTFVEKVETPSRKDLLELVDSWNAYKTVIQEEIASDNYDGDRVQAEGLAFAYLWGKHSEYLRVVSKIKPSDFTYGSKEVVMPNISLRVEELAAIPFVENAPDIDTDVTDILGITEHQQ